MKHFNRKIKCALLIMFVCLMAFVGFSKAGILFSARDSEIITVSITKKIFNPKNYVASVANLNNEQMITTNSLTKEATTTKETTTTKKITTIMTTTTTIFETTTTTSSWNGPVLTKSKGIIMGPSGKETYYNLNMSSIVKIMRNLGFSEEDYPYWVRDDGVKMLGNYVMVAASFDIRPRGSLVESSLGTAIVCDTGSFSKKNPTQLDIAVTW